MTKNEAPLAQNGQDGELVTFGEQRRHLGHLSVTEIFGASFDDPKGLGFDGVHVFAVEPEAKTDSPTLELQFEGEALHAARLAKLLNVIAPIKANGIDYVNAEAIIMDWRLLGEEDSPHSKSLFAAHSRLKGWDQLGLEYKSLIATLEHLDGRGRPQVWMLPGNEKIVKPAEWMEGWGTAESLANYHPLLTASELSQLLTDIYGREQAQSRIVQAIKYAIKDRPSDPERMDLQGLTDEELLSKFHTLGIEQRNQLISTSALQSTYNADGSRSWHRDESTKKFTALYLARHCVPFETKDGQIMYAHGLSPDEDIERAYAARRKVYVDSDRPRGWVNDLGAAYECEIMEVDTLIGRQEVIIPGTLRFLEPGLIPVVRWSVTASGKRTYQPLPEQASPDPRPLNVPSGVAGLMLVAYFQPEKYKKWPRVRGLPGFGSRLQYMAEAQVPLLVLEQAGRLLDNELMEQAEALAATST